MSEVPIRFPEIEVNGSPREMGRQLGEAAREKICEFVSRALERVNLTISITRDRAYQIARDSLVHANSYSVAMVDELKGMAESAGVSLEDLMLLQVRNQFTVESDAGCTSFAATQGVVSPSLVAQNWDNDPALDPYTVVLTRRPKGKPALINVTQVGLIAYIGLNEHGIGACLNTLPAPSRPAGVPHYFTLRGIFESSTLDDAIHAVRRAERAVPANILLTTPQGPADLEVTIDEVYVLREDQRGHLTHTNHCVHDELVAINEQFDELIESGPRKTRIDQQLLALQRPLTVEDAQKLLADHEGFPRSICRHPNDHPQHGFWETVLSVVIAPESRTMHIARGTPCCRPFETYRLD
ncbi:MAG: peptidase C45 [Planctomycetaceae bacterium]|nr:peptidase C45 [Planctomycetaceae bacterium]